MWLSSSYWAYAVIDVSDTEVKNDFYVMLQGITKDTSWHDVPTIWTYANATLSFQPVPQNCFHMSQAHLMLTQHAMTMLKDCCFSVIRMDFASQTLTSLERGYTIGLV